MTTQFFNIEKRHVAPNQHFLPWLQHQTALFISVILATVGAIKYIFDFAHSVYINDIDQILDRLDSIKRVIHISHIIIIICFIIILYSILDKNDIGKYRSRLVYRRIFKENYTDSENTDNLNHGIKDLKRFKQLFLMFWVTILFLYVSLVIKSYSPPELENNSYWGVMDYTKYSYISTILNNISLLFIYWCFTILYSPARDHNTLVIQRQLRSYSGIVIFMIIVAFPLFLKVVENENGYIHTNIKGYVTAFDAISGTLNGLALALLIARLDSKLIGLPSWLISVLYTYSAVQPLYIAFDQEANVFKLIETAVLLIVFLLKIYFFCIIVYAMQTGRLLNYLYNFPILKRRVDSIFDNQFKIDGLNNNKEFCFSVFKNNIKIFSSELVSMTKKDNRYWISRLQKVSEEPDSYVINEQSGTYWLEIIDHENHKELCSSISLRSLDETLDLKIEAIEKIPYCKVDFG